jgi:hypothetical protein
MFRITNKTGHVTLSPERGSGAEVRVLPGGAVWIASDDELTPYARDILALKKAGLLGVKKIDDATAAAALKAARIRNRKWAARHAVEMASDADD